ncbi:hypothetical protein HK102_005651, partial [Quaeritorhiza haematococci]
LDSYNAYNVIESLVTLAREYQRTVILTIHQPRSNIFALFDKLVLLAKGKTVYSGPAQEEVLMHFGHLGFECPMGFNIADYLVDLTMHAITTSERYKDDPTPERTTSNSTTDDNADTNNNRTEVTSGGSLTPLRINGNGSASGSESSSAVDRNDTTPGGRNGSELIDVDPAGRSSTESSQQQRASLRSPVRKLSIRAQQENQLFTPKSPNGPTSPSEAVAEHEEEEEQEEEVFANDDGDGTAGASGPSSRHSPTLLSGLGLNLRRNGTTGEGEAVQMDARRSPASKMVSSAASASASRGAGRRGRGKSAAGGASRGAMLSSATASGIRLRKQMSLNGLMGGVGGGAAGNGGAAAVEHADHLKMLVDGYASSAIGSDIREEIERAVEAQKQLLMMARSGSRGSFAHGLGLGGLGGFGGGTGAGQGSSGSRRRSFGIIADQGEDEDEGADADGYNTAWGSTANSRRSSIMAARRSYPLSHPPLAGAASTSSSPTHDAHDVSSAWLSVNKHHHRATWWTQFKILSGRTFKNLYRNPNLLRTHYAISLVVAVACGLLFWKVSNDIAGFQNRMGVFFFICALFGFSCLSSMQVFASERLIFVRERANQYYSPITYYSAKVLFDIIPLRVVPPFILGLIIYHMIGLRADSPIFLLKFLLVLVMFNLTAAACCLLISIVFRELGVANLLATLVMLFEMLFGGLLLNKSSIPSYMAWLNNFSFFNCALEALVVNEVNGLTLYENKYGLMIDVSIWSNLLLWQFHFRKIRKWAVTVYSFPYSSICFKKTPLI